MSSVKELNTLASATGTKKANVANNDKQATTTTNEVSQEINTKDAGISDQANFPPKASQKARAKKLRAMNSKLKKAKAAEVAEKAKAGTLTRQPIVEEAPVSTTDEDSSCDSKDISETEQTQPSPDKPALDTDNSSTMTPASEDDSVSDSQDGKPKLTRLQKLQKKKMADVIVKADVKIRKSKPKKHIPLPPKKDHSKKGMFGLDIFASRPRSSQTSRSSSSGSVVTPTSPTSSTYKIATPTGSTHVPLSGTTPPLPDASLDFFEEEESSHGSIVISDHDEHDEDVEEIVASAPILVATKETPNEVDVKDATVVIESTEDLLCETEDIADGTQTPISAIENNASDAVDVAPEQTTEICAAPDDKLAIDTALDQGQDTIKEPVNNAEENTEGDVKSTKDTYLASFLARPNGAGEDMSVRHLQEKLVALHVDPFVEPQREQNKPSRKEKKASKSNKTTTSPPVEVTAQPITPADPVAEERVLDESHDSPPAVETAVEVAVVDDAFVADLLALPNGCAEGITLRHLREDMVAMHVMPPMKPSQQLNKKDKKQVTTTLASVNKSFDKKTLSAERSSEESALIAQDIQGKKQDIQVKTRHTIYDNTQAALLEAFMPATKWEMPSPRSSKASSMSTTSSELSEREMYKAQQTFIGTISLVEFLSELNIHHYTSSKDDVCRAFAACAAKEAEIYGFHKDSTTDPDFDTMLVQCRTKLGSKTLHAFLRGINFDEEGVTPVSCVINGFYSAAASDVGPSAKVMRALESASDSSS